MYSIYIYSSSNQRGYTKALSGQTKKLKRGFHEPTEINKINHRCIQIGRQVLQTFRHRHMDIGAVLAAN